MNSKTKYEEYAKSKYRRDGTIKKIHVQYLLNDGTSISPHELKEQLGTSYSGAINRLEAYDDPKMLFRPLLRSKGGPVSKEIKEATRYKGKPVKTANWGPMTEERLARQPMQDPMYILMMKVI